MRNFFSKLLLVMLFFLLSASLVEAGWVLTKDGWVRTNNLERRKPEQIYEDAKKAFEEKRFGEAYEDYRILGVFFTRSKFAEESLFMCGECLFQGGRYRLSSRFFKDYLVHYPGTERTANAIDRLHEIGKAFLDGRRVDIDWPFISFKFMSNRELGVQILSEIVETYPYIEKSDLVQLTIAEFYIKDGQNAKAQESLEKFLEQYLISAHREYAIFLVGKNYFQWFESENYTSENLPKAQEAFRQYTKKYGEDGKYAQELLDYLGKINKAFAKKEFLIADYYRRTGSARAAIVCYENILQKYPDDPHAEKARAALDQLKAGEKPK